MREVLDELIAIRRRGGMAAIATVVGTRWSTARSVGASMLVTDSGEVVGSVGGGCVEAEIFAAGEEVLRHGVAQLETYGVSDDDMFAVGFTCGGVIDVFIERVDSATWPELEGIASSIAAREPVAIATIVKGGRCVGRRLVVRPDRTEGTLGTARLDETIREEALAMLAAGATATLHHGPDGRHPGPELEVFVTSYAPPAQLFIFGAADFSAPLVRVGKLLGFRVSVCDARPVFATRKRFPDADEVVVDWPHRWLGNQQVDERTVIAVLTHDPKFDVPVLRVALRSKAGYVGAMGSRGTHEDRLSRLKAAGITDAECDRLHSPIGLDLGARTPEETAISIAAEIVAARWGGSGSRLTGTTGPIHPASPAARRE
mgnify:FL=1